MTWQLANAKVWDGSQWVAAVGGGGSWQPRPVADFTSFVTATASTTAHTKGAWVEVIASTTADADCIDVAVQGIGAGGTNTATLVDIGVGASGAEVVTVADVNVGGWIATLLTGDRSQAFRVPVYIPAGSRIAVRIQSLVTGGKTGQFAIRLSAGSNPAGTSTTTTTIGAVTASSAGTAFPNTLNTWAQVIASTATKYSFLSLIPAINTSAIGQNWRSFQLGVGSSGNEVAILQLDTVNSSQEVFTNVRQDWTPQTVSSGSRLAVRGILNTTNTMTYVLVATETLGT